MENNVKRTDGMEANDEYGRHYTWYEGKRFYGPKFTNGLPEGEYVVRWPEIDELFFEGTYKSGMRDGYGVAYNENGLAEYKGYYKNGAEEGHGKYYVRGDYDSLEQIIEGEFEEGHIKNSPVIVHDIIKKEEIECTMDEDYNIIGNAIITRDDDGTKWIQNYVDGVPVGEPHPYEEPNNNQVNKNLENRQQQNKKQPNH